MKPYIKTYIKDNSISQQKVDRAELLVKTMLENPTTLDRPGFGEIEDEVIRCAIDELRMLRKVNGFGERGLRFGRAALNSQGSTL